jgi:hypothetical protein
VQLQAEAHWQLVRKEPFGQLSGTQSRPATRGILENRREEDLQDARVQLVLTGEIARNRNPVGWK